MLFKMKGERLSSFLYWFSDFIGKALPTLVAVAFRVTKCYCYVLKKLYSGHKTNNLIMNDEKNEDIKTDKLFQVF